MTVAGRAITAAASDAHRQNVEEAFTLLARAAELLGTADLHVQIWPDGAVAEVLESLGAKVHDDHWADTVMSLRVGPVEIDAFIYNDGRAAQ